MMVPLRRALIVKEHGVLPYPEGTACADVLVAGERGGKLAALVFSGLGVGALWKALSWVFNLFRTEVGYTAPRTSQFPERHAQRRHLARVSRRRLRHRPAHRRRDVRRRRAVVAGAAAAALDPRRSTSPCRFRRFIPTSPNNPATGQPFLISEMAPAQLWSAYIRYIGAGAVLAAGLITLARTIPTIVSSARRRLEGIRRRRGGAGRLRTEREIPMSVVLDRLAAARALPGARAATCRCRATSWRRC